MNLSLRLFLISCLVALQFIAPLVHAHTGEKNSETGLHIPGLEAYKHSSHQYGLNATQAIKTLSCKAILLCNDNDGQVVGVDTGFSRNLTTATQKIYKLLADTHSGFLPVTAVIFATGFSTFFIILPTDTELLTGRLAYFSHSPRAPPANV
jgi:hypothetical protein